MNIALIGYGRMGKAIEEQAILRGHQVKAIFDLDTPFLEAKELNGIDVCIEFTQPDSPFANCAHCLSLGVPVVSGTTGWNADVAVLQQRVEKSGGTFFYASNFSLGVNILFELNQQLAKIMQAVGGYTPEISETHHIHKKDAPSGTAVTLAEGITTSTNEWKDWTLKPDEKENCIPIEAIREEEVPGIHEIKWTSEIDELKLYHNAFNRQGFALGSVLAAEYAHTHQGVLTMSDMLGLGNK